MNYAHESGSGCVFHSCMCVMIYIYSIYLRTGYVQNHILCTECVITIKQKNTHSPHSQFINYISHFVYANVVDYILGKKFKTRNLNNNNFFFLFLFNAFQNKKYIFINSNKLSEKNQHTKTQTHTNVIIKKKKKHKCCLKRIS